MLYSFFSLEQPTKSKKATASRGFKRLNFKETPANIDCCGQLYYEKVKKKVANLSFEVDFYMQNRIECKPKCGLIEPTILRIFEVRCDGF